MSWINRPEGFVGYELAQQRGLKRRGLTAPSPYKNSGSTASTGLIDLPEPDSVKHGAPVRHARGEGRPDQAARPYTAKSLATFLPL